MGGDAEQDYFADGVTESLTTDPSHISGSFVIGRHTAFTYKGKSTDLRQVGRELNVRYILEGSVQRAGRRLRVWLMVIGAAKLNLDAAGEAVVWLRRSIDANRNNPLAQVWLADALMRLGELDEAKAAARAALVLDPTFTIRRLRARAPWRKLRLSFCDVARQRKYL